jgi:hypothetical protein
MQRRHLKPRGRAAILDMSTGRPLVKVRVGEVPCIKPGKGSKAHIRFDPDTVIKPLQANG